MFDGPFENLNDFATSLQAQVGANNGLCLCVFDLASKRQVGVANFMNNCPSHLKIELGGIWYSPIAQRTAANTEATYLMLKHAFDLGYRRLEWKCDAKNERSRKAALRMGFKLEGIQESHMIVKGCNRDTAWFRILDTEWPKVREKLEQILYKVRG
jgi:RimJ/RimL family protein N-acetyltransferase